MAEMESLRARGNATNTPSYAPSLVLQRGEGLYVWDVEGNRYLDFLAGIAVNCLGHCHPKIVEAVQRQAAELMQISNAFYSPVQVAVQEKLVELSFGDRVFLCNSGAEANEAAMKLAKRYQRVVRGEDRTEFVTFHHSFHGRTLAAITATGQPKYHKGFEPLVPGFRYASFNDLDSVRELVSDKTVAIMVEPIQGEGGVVPAAPGFLEGLRELADEHGALLIFDEVQTGMGRSGHVFAYQHFGVAPDIMSLAKGLGGGVPIGAMVSTNEVFQGFVVGSHASTFGGNPLACAAANVVLDEVSQSGLLESVRTMGQRLRRRLREAKPSAAFKEVRGVGLMNGAELGDLAKDVVRAARRRGLLCNTAGGATLRFVPPLIVDKAAIDEAVTTIVDAIEDVASDNDQNP